MQNLRNNNFEIVLNLNNSPKETTMPRSLRSLTIITAGLLLVALSVLTPTRRAEAQVDLIVSVIDTIASAGAQNTPISIFRVTNLVYME